MRDSRPAPEDIRETASPPVLLVADGKGGHQRVIPFADVLAEEIATWDLSLRGWLFHRHNSFAPITAHIVSSTTGRYLRLIGIADTLHSLRHWFATTVYAMTSDLRLVQEILGHYASPLTTARYAAWSPSKAATAIRTLNLGAASEDSTPVEIRPRLRTTHPEAESAGERYPVVSTVTVRQGVREVQLTFDHRVEDRPAGQLLRYRFTHAHRCPAERGLKPPRGEAPEADPGRSPSGTGAGQLRITLETHANAGTDDPERSRRIPFRRLSPADWPVGLAVSSTGAWETAPPAPPRPIPPPVLALAGVPRQY